MIKRFTWEELAESQEFEHGQVFVKLEDFLEVVALAKSNFDILKTQRQKAIEIFKEIESSPFSYESTKIIAGKALEEIAR